MSAPPQSSGTPITSRDQLIAYFAAGNKPRSAWRIGTEHEKIGFSKDTLAPLPYFGPAGIRRILEDLAQKFAWEPLFEGDNPIALKKDGCSITLEPGGQFELSGAPLENVHQTCDEVHTHLDQVREITEPLGLGMLGIGFQPKWPREAIHWMPKGRYRIMKAYMPKKGNLGLDMMTRSCTVQVNLDFESEADMVAKFRIGLALQPLATALFANSPFTEGQPNGFLSYRSHIWTDTDPDRCGMLPFVFEEGMGFERYTDYILDMPMYFIYRDSEYIDCSGQSFRDFMEGRLPALPGELPTTSDWVDHVSTAFPEVRLKTFLEMRGADGGPWRSLCGLPAFWVGLLYDADAQADCAALIEDWSIAEMEEMRRQVPRQGLKTLFRGQPLRALARQVLEISSAGLARRAVAHRSHANECHFLESLFESVEGDEVPAERLLRLYRGTWGESVDPLFREEAY